MVEMYIPHSYVLNDQENSLLIGLSGIILNMLNLLCEMEFFMKAKSNGG